MQDDKIYLIDIRPLLKLIVGSGGLMNESFTNRIFLFRILLYFRSIRKYAIKENNKRV